MWLADDDQVEAIERREAEVLEEEAKAGKGRKRKAGAGAKRKEVSMDDMYHEGESHFHPTSFMNNTDFCLSFQARANSKTTLPMSLRALRRLCRRWRVLRRRSVRVSVRRLRR